MLRVLFLFLVCLSLSWQSAAVAPAVCTTTACIWPIPVPISPLICVRGLATIPNPSSNSIHTSRTLFSIVQSCVLTIFACVWVAVHRNIPGPKQSWISIHFEWFKVLVLTLLVPEWILAWAVRQFLSTRKIARELEDARATAQKFREKNRVPALATEHGGRSASGDREGAGSEVGYVDGSREDEALLDLQRTHMDGNASEAAGVEVPDTWTRQSRLGRTKESWTKTHAFFVIMGGFHFYDHGEPLYPLSPEDAINLVRPCALVLPTSNELKDRSKGDTLSKGVAILQTLWFVMQCIARRIEHLPITSLEVTTLAYTVITFAMYAAWWHKPLNISCAIRVPGTAAEKDDADPESVWGRIFVYVMGIQDMHITLSQQERVPTFWACCRDESATIADISALTVAMVFGAVHCIVWSYAFPSQIEELMWRASAISIIAVPVAMLLSYVVCCLISLLSETLAGIVVIASLTVCAIIYIAARFVLLVLSFTTLRSLPFWCISDGPMDCIHPAYTYSSFLRYPQYGHHLACINMLLTQNITPVINGSGIFDFSVHGPMHRSSKIWRHASTVQRYTNFSRLHRSIFPIQTRLSLACTLLVAS